MINQFKKLTPVVRELLETYPATRDCDRTLIIKVWEKQSPYLDSIFTNFAQFKTAFISGKFANPESIRRSRALIQSREDKLRGRNYKKRKVLAVEVKEGINKI